MGGWKTWTGVALIFIAGGMEAIASSFAEYSWLSTLGQVMLSAGAAMGFVGIGSKIEKNAGSK